MNRINRRPWHTQCCDKSLVIALMEERDHAIELKWTEQEFPFQTVSTSLVKSQCWLDKMRLKYHSCCVWRFVHELATVSRVVIVTCIPWQPAVIKTHCWRPIKRECSTNTSEILSEFHTFQIQSVFPERVRVPSSAHGCLVCFRLKWGFFVPTSEIRRENF